MGGGIGEDVYFQHFGGKCLADYYSKYGKTTFIMYLLYFEKDYAASKI